MVGVEACYLVPASFVLTGSGYLSRGISLVFLSLSDSGFLSLVYECTSPPLLATKQHVVERFRQEPALGSSTRAPNRPTARNHQQGGPHTNNQRQEIQGRGQMDWYSSGSERHGRTRMVLKMSQRTQTQRETQRASPSGTYPSLPAYSASQDA